MAELKSDYGSEDTYDSSLLLEGRRGPWGALVTGGILGTDGFVITTPSQRGLIDIPSNVHAQNGAAILDHTSRAAASHLPARLGDERSAQQRHPGPDQRNPPLALRHRRRLEAHRHGHLGRGHPRLPRLRLGPALPPDLFHHRRRPQLRSPQPQSRRQDSRRRDGRSPPLEQAHHPRAASPGRRRHPRRARW